jgi:hypothetical protein
MMRGRATYAALGLLLLAAAALPAPASAVPLARPYVTSFGSFQNPRDIAVDQSNGDVYVLDAGARTISRFDSSLKAKKFTALNSNVIDGTAAQTCVVGVASANCDQTPFNGFSFDVAGGAQVAIDTSGSPLTNGDVYVADSFHNVVAVFAPSGAYLGQLGRSGAAGPLFGRTLGVAVDPGGAVYVADAGGKVHKFAPTANPPTDADFVTDFTSPEPAALAAGAGPTAGSLFVNKKAGTVAKLNAAGALQYQLSGVVGRGVAVDPSSGYVYVATGAEAVGYAAAGAAPAAVESFGSNQVTAAGSVAVDAAGGKAYVSDTSNGKVYVYGPPAPVSLPTVALGLPSPRSPSSVVLAGYVTPGSAPTTYYFEYGAADCAGGGCTSVPLGHDGALGKGSGPFRVSQPISGLEPGASYHYRLVASDAAGSAASPDEVFSTTLTPAVGGPCPNAQRRGEQRAQALPDCRAYELVSTIPAGQRNGIEILPNTKRVRAAADGAAFQFSALGGAADVEGVPYSAEYMGVRDPGTGWSVHGITPRQESGAPENVFFGREPAYQGEFSPDLSSALFLSASPLSDEGPNVRSVFSLYRRDDLLTPGPGTYRLLSDATTPQSPHPPGQSSGEDMEWPKLVGSSADLSHVVFESTRNLTADAVSLPAGPRLYESSAGALRLVGVLPAAAGGGLTLAKAGRGYGGYPPHAVSADGSRVMFMAPPFAGSERAGTLYLRDDHGTANPAGDTTVQVNAGEKTNGSGPGGADPVGPQPAFFADASVDMESVFFRSTEALTDDAPADEPTVAKLYRYEVGAPSGSHLTLLSVDHNAADGINDGSEGTIGVSRDGSYVYFVNSNQLVAGRPVTAGPRIFVWHQGTIQQVGAINSGAEQTRILNNGLSAWQEGGQWARVSPDGKQLLFVSEGSADLAGYDQGTSCPEGASTRCKEVYLYSAADSEGGERLQCVSCSSAGLAASGDADFNAADGSSLFVAITVGGPYLNHALSIDGRLVFFTSAERLSPYDENNIGDVYEFDSTSGQVSLISGGRPGVASSFLDASSDGRDVFFLTRSPLLAGDGNQLTDVYDARVGGGFAEAPAPPPPCASTLACRPATSAPPAAPAAESLPAPAAGRRHHAGRRHRQAKKRHRGHHRHGKVGARNG